MVNNIAAYLALDATSPTGLVWLTKPSPRVNISIGTPAFTAIDNKGYYRGSLHSKQLFAHVVVFWLTHGYRPTVVDHIDGNKQNNSPDNLRAVSTSENAHNTICAGYTKHTCGKWRARIRVNGKDKHLGLFLTEQEARQAYLDAKAELHPTAPSRCYILNKEL